MKKLKNEKEFKKMVFPIFPQHKVLPTSRNKMAAEGYSINRAGCVSRAEQDWVAAIKISVRCPRRSAT